MDHSNLKAKIQQRGFIQQNAAWIPGQAHNLEKDAWLFDFKLVLLNETIIHTMSEVFFSTLEWDNFQIGGLESSSIPLIVSVLAGAQSQNRKATGFFVRKNRKKTDLCNIIEGNFDPTKRTVVVDDILNTGTSLIKTLQALNDQGFSGELAIFSILQYRDDSYYRTLLSSHKELAKYANIPIHHVFTLNDLSDVLPVKNLENNIPSQPLQPDKFEWSFAITEPNLHHVIPKSGLAMDELRLYYGTDRGVFYCLEKETGKTIWEFKVPFGSKGKYIYSTPLLIRGRVFFGAYDGNLYCLDAQTGKKVWTYWDADWVGSSPCADASSKIIYIGLEFGLWKKRGGVAALDAVTGKSVWVYRDIPGYVHASPAVSTTAPLVFCGSNQPEPALYALNTKTGVLAWKYPIEGDIKAGVAIDEHVRHVYVASFDEHVYCIDFSGHLVWKFKADSIFYATPLLYKDLVIVGSSDKHVYALNRKTGNIVWSIKTDGRILCSPTLVDGYIAIGNNEGVLRIINSTDGSVYAHCRVPNRITNPPLYDPSTQSLYISTQACEVFKVKKWW